MYPKLHCLIALGLALLAVGGPAPGARAADCRHTDAVFYNATDTGGRLVGELKKFESLCADYYVSVTPRTGPGVEGFPRPGLPVDAIHAAGPRFHAMAEIRLNPWATYVSTHPTPDSWYDAGRVVRQLMKEAGYDPARGDTWALNEVGEPSNQAMGLAVIKDAPGARENLLHFIHGLYDGDGTPMPGLVFAADPMQVTTNLSDYREDLESWYADSEFWVDVTRYVRFWAQETYADVRTWGVPESTLATRSAYLGDFFMHGARVAARGGEAAAARAFFEHAYTPIGNAVYRFQPTGIVGFGSTDVDLSTMLNFVSTQTYTLRSLTGDRFGFADQRVATATVAQVVAVEDRLAAAIKDSETDPGGACGASAEWCDSTVAGAEFTGLWRELGNPTPPAIVPHVEGPLGHGGWYTGDVTVTWSVEDLESPLSSTTGCQPTVIDADTPGTTLTCTATSFGGTRSVDVTVRRDATPPDVSCEATPSVLWPPNHRLVPVTVAVDIADDTSGPGGFVLTRVSATEDASTGDMVGFEVGTADDEGFLRAERPEAASEGLYRLTYLGHDVAGNSDECVATIAVPHDQRG